LDVGQRLRSAFSFSLYENLPSASFFLFSELQKEMMAGFFPPFR